MNIVTNTPFQAASHSGRIGYPNHSLTLVVKAAFDLHNGEPATVAEAQPYPSGDEFYPDDEARRGGPRYESDFAYFKPRADLLLVGNCHAPRGKQARWCPATFRAGEVSKTLTVFGDRRWERRGLSWRTSEPELFRTMPLRYERSFGGHKFAANPVGSGGQRVKDEQGEEFQPLPNLEDPRRLIESRRDRLPPAGFGPLSATWETRKAKTGTYKKNYLETRWPWFPEDFDWGHFNAAPEDMQVEGYLRGDEELYFQNLHPVHSEYTSRLPGVRVRCFVNRRTSPDAEQTEFVEVSMNLDTLWADMETEQVVLVWRGWTQVASEDHEDVQDIFITTERLTEQPASVEHCYQAFLARQAEEDEDFEPAPEPVEAGEAASAREPRGAEGARPAAADLKAHADALLAQFGIGTDDLPYEAQQEQSRLMEKLTETDPDKLFEMESRAVDEQLREALARGGLDPDRLPPLSAKAKAEQFRFLKEMGIQEPHLASGQELTEIWTMLAAVMSKGGMDPEDLSPAIEHARKIKPQLGSASGASDGKSGGDGKVAEDGAGGSGGNRKETAERAAREGSFADADLRDADLSRLDLQRADLSGANLAGAKLIETNLGQAILTRANLQGADLTGADLTRANLAGADLTSALLNGATLRDADLSATNLTGASLTGATLVDATFEKAQMAGAACNETRAVDAIFVESDLTGANFRESDCSGADFSKATLNEATFGRARLVEASLEGATGHRIELADADLTAVRAGGGADFRNGVFSRAAGKGSIWEEANLAGADFRGARLPEALFTGACLTRANFHAADMRLSRFTKADLREAHLVQMNLFRSSLARADLSAADCSGSNLYEVEFLDSVIEGTTFRDANLKMTSLADKVPH